MECSLAPLDRDAFARVWRRVMPCDRPDCPFTLSPPAAQAPVLCPEPERPALCLSPDSTADLPRLELLLLSVTDARRCCQALAGRLNSRLFARLAAEKKRQSDRLAAAHYLITGRPFPLEPTPTPRPTPMPLALRERFHAEQRQAAVLLSAAHRASDPGLAALYRQLAREDRQAALAIWEALADLQS